MGCQEAYLVPQCRSGTKRNIVPAGLLTKGGP